MSRRDKMATHLRSRDFHGLRLASSNVGRPVLSRGDVALLLGVRCQVIVVLGPLLVVEARHLVGLTRHPVSVGTVRRFVLRSSVSSL